MVSLSIRDLTHWEAWEDFLLIWKHTYYLPTGGNCCDLCNSTGAIGSVVFNGFKQVVVYMAWTLILCFRGVTHEWMSSVFEVLFLFWFVEMFLLSSLDEMDVRVKLLADDVWSAEDDKTGFLSFGVDSLDRLYLKERPISFPTVKISTKNDNIRNEDKWESSTNRNMRFFWWMIKILCLVIPPYGKAR